MTENRRNFSLFFAVSSLVIMLIVLWICVVDLFRLPLMLKIVLSSLSATTMFFTVFFILSLIEKITAKTTAKMPEIDIKSCIKRISHESIRENIDSIIKLYDILINGLGILTRARDFRESIFVPLSFAILFIPFSIKTQLQELSMQEYVFFLYLTWLTAFVLLTIASVSIFRFSLYIYGLMEQAKFLETYIKQCIKGLECIGLGVAEQVAEKSTKYLQYFRFLKHRRLYFPLYFGLYLALFSYLFTLIYNISTFI